MKKLGLVLLTVIALNTTTFAAEKVNTTFTFQNFVPTSADVVTHTAKSKALGSSMVSYPLFTGNVKIAETMNKHMENFIKDFNDKKNESYKVTYKVTGSNEFFVSVLFDVEVKDKKTGAITKKNEAISFNTKNGKPLFMKDLFISGFDGPLNTEVSNKAKQFGIPLKLNKKGEFEGVSKQQKFYMEDDSIVFFYNKGEATDFADGQLFIPFLTVNLIGIIK